jgi:dihydrofolate reductase
MAILTVTTFVTLDGVMQAPGGPTEDPSDGFTHGGWLVPYADPDLGAFIADVFSRATAFLLGRRTYDIFAGHWPRVTDPADPVAAKLNALPKYVVSKTLAKAEWNNSSVLRDVLVDVTKLKHKNTGEVQVHGSAGLLQALIQSDLIDEYNILTFPVILGSGRKLFGAAAMPSALQLKSSRTTSTGTILSTYRRAGKPSYGSFQLDP